MTTSSGYLRATRAFGSNVTLSGLSPGGSTYPSGRVMLLLGQTDGTQNGPWKILSGAWERIEWTGASVHVEVGLGSVTDGDPFDGLYKLPDAAGLTFGSDAITVTRV